MNEFKILLCRCHWCGKQGEGKFFDNLRFGKITLPTNWVEYTVPAPSLKTLPKRFNFCSYKCKYDAIDKMGEELDDSRKT